MTLINYTDHFVVTFLNPTYYAGIMLDAFNNLLCSRLCCHNRPGPSHLAIHDRCMHDMVYIQTKALDDLQPKEWLGAKT